MKRILLRAFGVVLLVLLMLAAFVWIRSAAPRRAAALRQSWRIDEAALALPTDAEALARGRSVAVTRGCTGCHGTQLGGDVIMEQPPIGRLPDRTSRAAKVASSAASASPTGNTQSATVSDPMGTASCSCRRSTLPV